MTEILCLTAELVRQRNNLEVLPGVELSPLLRQRHTKVHFNVDTAISASPILRQVYQKTSILGKPASHLTKINVT